MSTATESKTRSALTYTKDDGSADGGRVLPAGLGNHRAGVEGLRRSNRGRVILHHQPLTFGSLFSGIGGADLGFERAGLVPAFQVEIDPYCRKVLERHWPHVRRHDDIRTFPPETGDWSCDILVGGDPCQGNSNAGSVWKKKHEDLGSEFVRVAGVLRPRVVVRENPWPSRADALWPWWRMRSALAGLGYLVLPFRLRSCCLGACHRRDRVWLLAERADAHGERVSDSRRGQAGGTPSKAQAKKGQSRLSRNDAGSVVGGPHGPNADGNGLQGIDGAGEPSGDVGRVGGVRQLGQREDGVPAPRVCRSRHEVPNLMDRVRVLGNSIDPAAAEWIGRRIIEAARMPGSVLRGSS